ncbi:MAG TPA: hypothetical protein VIJ51_15295 [Solirubrobacteraceae bacterium]
MRYLVILTCLVGLAVVPAVASADVLSGVVTPPVPAGATPVHTIQSAASSFDNTTGTWILSVTFGAPQAAATQAKFYALLFGATSEEVGGSLSAWTDPDSPRTQYNFISAGKATGTTTFSDGDRSMTFEIVDPGLVGLPLNMVGPLRLSRSDVYYETLKPFTLTAGGVGTPPGLATPPSVGTPPPAGPTGPTTPVTPTGSTTPGPAKLEVARATIAPAARVIDVLAPITARASGDVSLDLYAAGRHSVWTAPIDPGGRAIHTRHAIPAGQADAGTGILTITYPGDADTQPQVVRLRAANGRADLVASRPAITGGKLVDHGTISARARGVVRVELQLYTGGRTVTLDRNARIADGRWSLDDALTTAEQAEIAGRQGTVESNILFTGYLPRDMRGEMLAYQVLGAP